MIDFVILKSSTMTDLFNIVFMMTKHPTTCPNCGVRSEIISDLLHTNSKSQIHKCLNVVSQNIFVETEDTEFLHESYKRTFLIYV